MENLEIKSNEWKNEDRKELKGDWNIMEMTLRWYGEGYDSVTLNQIRQIPGVTGVISTLYGTQPGEEWKDEEIKKLKSQVETAGLHLSGIEV